MTLLASVLAVGCPWLCNPDTPGTPFATAWLALWDVLRVLTFVTAMAVIVSAPSAIARCRTPGQRARFIAFALWGLAVLTSNAEHLGDEPGVRLLLSAAASAYALYGTRAFFRAERPSERGAETSRHAP